MRNLETPTRCPFRRSGKVGFTRVSQPPRHSLVTSTGAKSVLRKGNVSQFFLHLFPCAVSLYKDDFGLLPSLPSPRHGGPALDRPDTHRPPSRVWEGTYTPTATRGRGTGLASRTALPSKAPPGPPCPRYRDHRRPVSGNPRNYYLTDSSCPRQWDVCRETPRHSCHGESSRTTRGGSQNSRASLLVGPGTHVRWSSVTPTDRDTTARSENPTNARRRPVRPTPEGSVPSHNEYVS